MPRVRHSSATTTSAQNDIYTSYRELKNVWNTYPHTIWLRDEMSLSLAKLAEMGKPLEGQKQTR